MHFIKSFLILFFLLVVGKYFFPSTIILLFCYIIIILTLRKQNPLNPLFWLFSTWGILFSNEFSGIIQYKIIGDKLNISILLFITSILVFFAGYLIKASRYPQNTTTQIPKVENFIKENETSFYISKYGYFFSWMSIIALFMLIMDVVILLGADITNPSLLRQQWNDKEGASIFGQLSAILFAGGYFSITCFFLFNPRKLFFIFGVFAFAFASIFSAGRQQMFQVIILVFLCISFRHYLKLPIGIPRKIKTIFYVAVILMGGYFIFISANRNKADGETRTMMEIFAAINSFEYSDDFIAITKNLPPALNGLVADLSFYFSHQTHAFAEQSNYEDMPIINFKPLLLLTFIERQIDKVVPREETQIERMQKNANKGTMGYLGSTTWKSANISVFRAFGYCGAFFLIFFHGMLSRLIFVNAMKKPSFLSLNIAIANCLFLFYTIMFPLSSETNFFFFIVILIVIYTLQKNKKLSYNI